MSIQAFAFALRRPESGDTNQAEAQHDDAGRLRNDRVEGLPDIRVGRATDTHSGYRR